MTIQSTTHQVKNSVHVVGIQRLFGIVVIVTFQGVFSVEIYQNNIFFIFLKSFLISAYQNDLKTPKHVYLK